MAEVEPQPSNQVRYQRVRGLWQTGTLGRASLFTGGDHLLLCDYRTGFTERYKRFYFKDIQAIIIQKTQHWLAGMAIWGSLAIGFLVIALASGWNAFLKITEGICLLFVLRHLIRGPSCRTRIQTAVQTDVLPMFKRVRKTNRVLSRILPLIEQAQGGAMATVPSATRPPLAGFNPFSEKSSGATAIPSGITEVPPSIASYSLSWLHVCLFAAVLLSGLNAIWEVNHPSGLSMGILLGLFFVTVVGGIVALVRQVRHRVHGGAALMTWLVVITFVIGMGSVDYAFAMVEAFGQARAGRPPLRVDFVSPFELRHMAGFDVVLWTFGICALLLGLLGLIFVFMRSPLRVQPPPLPGTTRP